MSHEPAGPQPGPPFRIGEHVVMFPAVVAPDRPGPGSVYLDWDEMVIDDIDESAESFGFHFVSEPGVRSGQGFENVVRADETYRSWRSAWLAAWEQTGSEAAANRETEELRLRVMAGQPIYGQSGSVRRKLLRKLGLEDTVCD